MSSQDLQLISDGSGLAVIGDPDAVDQFLQTQGLSGRKMDLSRVTTALGALGAVAQAGALVAQESGRWIQMTEESAQKVAELGMTTNSQTGMAMGMLRGGSGRIVHNIQFSGAPGLMNPMAIAAIGTAMTQMAMMQRLEDVQKTLEDIDEKVDDILRMQKDSELSKLVGVGAVLEEAMMIRDEVGAVSAVSWSKIDSAPLVIKTGQALALSRLAALTSKIEAKDIGDLSDVVSEVEREAREWLVVLARCAVLQDACDVLETDRVLDEDPETLEDHWRGLRLAADKRRADIGKTVSALLRRMDAVASVNSFTVVRHPRASRDVVAMTNRVAEVYGTVLPRMGIEVDRQAVESKAWSAAIRDVGASAVQATSDLTGAAVTTGARKLGSGLGVVARALTAASDSLEKAGQDAPKGIESGDAQVRIETTESSQPAEADPSED